MRLTPQLLGVGLLLAAATAVSAKPAYVASTVNLRAAPGTTSEVITKIPGGSLVDADNCTDGWCAVTWQEKRGFAIQTSLDMSGRVPPRRAANGPRPRGPVYGEEPVYTEEYVEGPPAYYYGPRPYYYGGYYGHYYGHYYRRGYRRW
jgi:uncharacterized protein YraI